MVCSCPNPAPPARASYTSKPGFTGQKEQEMGHVVGPLKKLHCLHLKVVWVGSLKK